MPSVRTTTFSRVVAPIDGEVYAAVAAIQAEANAFMATLPNLGDVLDIKHNIYPLTDSYTAVYPSRVLCSIHIVYVEV